jgi:exopolyphosphatase/guanosine-5'-triphosphate,3'-diphosphate pyrophosphatase
MKIEKYAAIDIGSNAIRILISNIFIHTKKPPVFLKSSMLRVPVRLGDDSFSTGEISNENIKHLIKALKVFSLLIKIHKVNDFMICATSALRESNNSSTIVKLVKKKLDLDIKIIDGRKEADLISNNRIFENLNSINLKNFLFVDVGGGSVEFSLIVNSKRVISKSYKIGTVRYLKKKIKKRIWIEIEEWIKLNTKKLSKLYILGSKILNIKEGNPLTILKLKILFNSLSKLNYHDRMYNYGLNPDRADVILPAIEIFLKVASWSGVNKIFIPKIGLSDGIIKELYKKNHL